MNTGKMDTIINSDSVRFCYEKSANDNALRLGEVVDGDAPMLGLHTMSTEAETLS